MPLYTIWLHPDKGYIAFAVIHCLAGDILVSGSVYIAASFAMRDSSWIVTQPWRGAAVAVPLGVLTTALSEWHNVYRARSWQYMPAMPLVFGIGLSPLLQWLLVPIATLFVVRWKLLRRLRCRTPRLE